MPRKHIFDGPKGAASSGRARQRSSLHGVATPLGWAGGRWEGGWRLAGGAEEKPGGCGEEEDGEEGCGAFHLGSQLEPDETWHKRAHYLTVDKPQGIEDMISIFLEPWKGTLVTMHTGSFSGPMDAELLGPAREFASVANSLLLARGGLARECGRPVAELSGREAEVMGWVSKGKRNSEIGAILELSVHTVRKHLENCFAKLGVETRTAAVVEFEKAKRADDEKRG